MAKTTEDKRGLAGIVKNVPRKIDIKGQPHMLAWITANEGKALELLGGSGEAGPMGIPAYYDEGDDYSGPGGDQAASSTGEQGDPSDSGFDGYDSAAGDTTTSDAETDDPDTAGRGSSEFSSDSIFSKDPEDRNWVEQRLVEKIQDEGLKNYQSLERDEQGNITGYYSKPGAPLGIGQGLMQFAANMLGVTPSVYTGFGVGSQPNQGMGGSGRDEPRISGLDTLQGEPKITPVSVSPADYYGKGIGSATIDMSDPIQREQFLMSLYGYTPSPIGAEFNPMTGTYTMRGGDKKRKTRLRGLDIFKPVSM